ncbi:hypothetical protein P7F88_17720 [Vibrio hannami]|uniref:hypothetical protein n=1 Tax=Vibrio hannami TaxID=2717094 RepID=UPI00240EE506|nr:hypothetical protein [Vibrio hannami]MDG3087806.1 hypothetical protein [Vibrio hannami]
MQKTVLVKAHFEIEYEYVKKRVATGEYERTLLGKKEKYKTVMEKVEKGISKSRIDSLRLAEDLQDAINELNNTGFKVTQIVPVTSGDYNYLYSDDGVSSSYSLFTKTESVSGGGSFGLGYGYSFTDSLIILAETSLPEY